MTPDDYHYLVWKNGGRHWVRCVETGDLADADTSNEAKLECWYLVRDRLRHYEANGVPLPAAMTEDQALDLKAPR